MIHFSNRQYRQSWFGRFAKSTAYYSGHPIVFGLAALTIVLWAMSGPLFGFSDTWQLVINTSTTIVTFLMVFLIQNTQNRDSQAVQIKLDELIRAIKGAHLSLLNLEELPDEELDRLRQLYCDLAEHARAEVARGKSDTGSPEAEGLAAEEDRANRGRAAATKFDDDKSHGKGNGRSKLQK